MRGKRKIIAIFLVLLMIASSMTGLFSIGTNAHAAEGYEMKVSVDETALLIGETASLKADVTYNGEAVTDLAAAGLKLWWWTDTWAEGHGDGNTDVTYSNYDNNSGHSLTADVTLPSVGNYYIAAELKDADNNRIWIEYVTFTVSEEGSTEENTEGYVVKATANNMAPEVGETVSLQAEVTYNGKAITDLEEAGLDLWWWTDVWAAGHTDGLNDAVYSNNDNGSGKSFTADVTLPSLGTYFVVAELKSGSESLYQYVFTFETTEDTSVIGEIEVKKIQNLSEDFIMGVDISSAIAEFNSGVTYKDFEGNVIDNITDFCKFLKECGITHVRIRVWNDPYDSEGNGYGGGNNDVNTAVKFAEACAAADLKMLVDFHYSDFWADPGKQQAPKAWKGFSLEEKVAALKAFTTDALTKIAATGADIAMVQVGNETNNALAGESANMCKLFQAGSEAIRAFDEDIKVVIHFTNPEKSNQLVNWAKRLNDEGVDYDILATSYYPFWHGTLENLKSQFETVQETYGKDVMVAETSYAYTLEDTDGHNDNSVREGHNDSVTSYAFTPQGQAECIRDIMAAVNEAGGLGVYYWEPAWITVGDTTGLTGEEYDAQVEANKEIWETYGSGWASSYATEYDPNDAGVWYGGSAVENQAMFYPDGTPNAALNVWEYVKTGSVSNTVSVDAIQNVTEAIEVNGTYTLPEAITITYNKGKVNENVTWNEEDVNAIDVATPGVYVVNGEVSFSKEVNTGDYAGITTTAVTYTLTVKEENLITDKDAAGFEKGDKFETEGVGLKAIPSYEDILEGNGTLHWYNPTATNSSVTYTDPITLSEGWYTFEVAAMGFEGDTITLQILDVEGNVLFTGEPAVMAGWTTVLSECQRAFVTFCLEEETGVKLQVCIGMNDGGWGSADAMYLHAHANLQTEDNGDGTQDVYCGDCGEFLKTEEKQQDDTTGTEDGKEEQKPDEDTTGKEDNKEENKEDDKSNDKENGKQDETVATGDTTNSFIYIVMIAACILVFVKKFGLKENES